MESQGAVVSKAGALLALLASEPLPLAAGQVGIAAVRREH